MSTATAERIMRLLSRKSAQFTIQRLVELLGWPPERASYTRVRRTLLGLEAGRLVKREIKRDGDVGAPPTVWSRA